MKTNILKTLIACLIVSFATSCTQDMKYKDVQVSEVSQVYAPADNLAIELLPSATASVYFEWNASLTEDQSAPLYEVVFDKEDGDFSKPFYRILSDGNGMQPNATILHKDLDRVAALAGVPSGETGTFKWTVCASKGLTQKMSTQKRTITITRLLAFENIPAEIYLYGEGHEAGNDVTKAIPFVSPSKDVFETYTHLEAGKTIKFSDSKVEGARNFYVEGSRIKEGDNGFTVEQTGEYYITVDFSISTIIFKRVTHMALFFSPTNSEIITMNYTNNGTWEGQGKVEFKEEGWGRDERYKINMTLVDAEGNEKKVQWGPTNSSLDSRPGDDQAQEYFDMKLYEPTQWDNKWKFHGRFDGQQTKVTVLLNADQAYTHKLELVNE
jgi:hypothetical protein